MRVPTDAGWPAISGPSSRRRRAGGCRSSASKGWAKVGSIPPRRTPYACPPDDAVHGVAVLDAIVKSARSGQREPIGW